MRLWLFGICLLLAPILPRGALAQAPAGTPPTSYLLLVASRSVDQTSLVRFSNAAGQVVHRTYFDFVDVNPVGPSQLVLLPDRRGYLTATQHGFPYGELTRFALAADSSPNEHQPPDTLQARVPVGAIGSVQLTPDGAFAWMTVRGGPDSGSSISVVYLARMAEVARIPACADAGGATFSADHAEYFVLCPHQDALTALATATMLPARSLVLGDATHRCGPAAVVAASDSGAIFVSCGSSHELLAIAPKTLQVTRRSPTRGVASVLALSPDGRTLIAVEADSATVVVRDAATGTMRRTIPTDTLTPAAVAISPDSRFAFVTVAGAGIVVGEVWMIDLATGARIASVVVGAGAQGIAFWKTLP
jgi:hypothetical protein